MMYCCLHVVVLYVCTVVILDTIIYMVQKYVMYLCALWYVRDKYCQIDVKCGQSIQKAYTSVWLYTYIVHTI